MILQAVFVCPTAHSCSGRSARPKVGPYCQSNGQPAVCSISIIYLVSHSLLVFCLNYFLSLFPFCHFSFLSNSYSTVALDGFLTVMSLFTPALPLSKSVLMQVLSVSGQATDTYTGLMGHTYTQTHTPVYCC